ncbi:MAG: ATP-binding protein [Gemmatimonadota bacterium]
MGPSEAPGRGLDLAVPPIPRSLGETGLSRDLLVGLLLKTVQQRGTLSGFGISDALGLPFSLVDDLLMDLQKSGMLEVKETDGPARSSYSFALTGKGRERAGEEAQASRYVGPAPVPFQQYVDWVLRQSVETVRIRRELLEEGLSDLVLPDGFLDLLGPAVNSGKSLFLYGDPGNGKTRIAEAVAELFGEAFFVPHAVDLDGHIMVLYDPVFHEALEPLEDSSWEHPPGPTLFRDLPRHDRRFVKVKRPVAMAGAELELSQLDLRYDPFGRTYQAPIQLKANGGVLVIDDLGRQRVRPRDLLNRWIVPLEHRVDYLSLESGKKIAVPFDCLVVFSTNIEPWELVEEAFLRRIHYKIRVSDPDPRQFDEIFSRCCEEEGIPFDPAAPEMVRREFYEPGKAIPRGCHPRDILSHLRDIALFRGMEPDLSPGLLRQACESYFVAMAPGEMPEKDPPEKGLTP